MIRNFKNGDIATSGLQFVEGKEYTAQSVEARLGLFLGEYFPDITQGTPWFQSILGKTPTDVAEISLKQRIITAPGVAGIRSFEYTPDPDNRNTAVEVTVINDEGEETTVQLEEVLA